MSLKIPLEILTDETFEAAPELLLAWLDLVQLVAKGENISLRRRSVAVEKGQLWVSHSVLAERWACSRTRVRSLLAELEKRQKISIKKDNFGGCGKVVLTIRNYETFCEEQMEEDEKKRQKKDTKKDKNDIVCQCGIPVSETERGYSLFVQDKKAMNDLLNDDAELSVEFFVLSDTKRQKRQTQKDKNDKGFLANEFAELTTKRWCLKIKKRQKRHDAPLLYIDKSIYYYKNNPHNPPTAKSPPPRPPPDSVINEFPHLASAKDAWKNFLSYRSELRRPLRPVSQRAQLKKWQNPKELIAAIERSIENGWQGIFPIAENKNQGGGGRRRGGAAQNLEEGLNLYRKLYGDKKDGSETDGAVTDDDAGDIFEFSNE
jgi:hypothetical protein